MGRILRKKRVGCEDSENCMSLKSDVVELKNPKRNASPGKASTRSSCKTQKRTVLMDKTNALKHKDEVKQNIGMTAPKLKDTKKSSQKPKGTDENLGKITRRRKSSKENEEEFKKSPQDEIESQPLGDKTNAPAPKKKLLQGAIGYTISKNEDIESEKNEQASNKKSVSSDEDNISKPVLSEPLVRKCPPRNASKFEDGWISALHSSRTLKESNRAVQKASSPTLKLKPEISPSIEETSPHEEKKRAFRRTKDGKSEKEVSSGTEPGENVASTPNEAVEQGVCQVLHSKQRRSSRISSKCGCSPLAANAGEVADQKNVPEESPSRKLPPRNAAERKKEGTSPLQKSRIFKENPCNPQKSPQKPRPLDERINQGKENKSHGSKSRAIAEEMPTKSRDSDEEKDSVPELRKGSVRRLGQMKNWLGSSAKTRRLEEKELERPQKPGATSTSTAESKSRGLKSFESRIAAKLGIDMSGSVSDTKTKVCDKISKKSSANETSSRRLRKRGVPQIKTYVEADGSEDEIVEKAPSNQGSKVTSNISDKSAKVSHRVNNNELNDIRVNSALTKAAGEQAMKATISPKEKDSESLNCNTKVHEPKPGCSRDSEYITTPLRRTSASIIPDATKKSPLVAPSSSLFSIFKKPDTPRRKSLENKIFVSGVNSRPADGTNKKLLPIYGNPSMTPLKRTSALPQEKKEELYDFEVDENEPKPKKRHKPIMKIQRVRAVKRKKPKVYEADPETERRVLKNLDLSPSVFEEFRSAKKKKVESAAGVIGAQPSQSPCAAEPVENGDDPHDTEAPDYHDLHFDVGPMSSPCRDYGQSTPIRTDVPSMFMDDSRDKFGRLSAKIYSPVKSKDSPIPVLMAEYNNDPVRGNDSRRSVASNASCVSAVSGNSIYQNDPDVTASTPVKFNRNNSTMYERQRREPVELNISNCFGFDEPEIMEEPLISPIKSTIQAPVPAVPIKSVPILKSKPPVMLPPPETPAVDVDQVIKQLRFEVGENSSANNSLNLSVYDDSEISLKNKSPIKRYLQPKHDLKHKLNKSANETAQDESNDSFSPIPVAPKVPRLSYERPNKLRKKKVLEPVYKEASENESAEDSELSDKELEPEAAEHIFEPTKNKYTAKKQAPKKRDRGMTKKEEEELEKWAQMFNSQCNQIDDYGLVVE